MPGRWSQPVPRMCSRIAYTHNQKLGWSAWDMGFYVGCVLLGCTSEHRCVLRSTDHQPTIPRKQVHQLLLHPRRAQRRLHLRPLRPPPDLHLLLHRLHRRPPHPGGGPQVRTYMPPLIRIAHAAVSTRFMNPSSLLLHDIDETVARTASRSPWSAAPLLGSASGSVSSGDFGRREREGMGMEPKCLGAGKPHGSSFYHLTCTSINVGRALDRPALHLGDLPALPPGSSGKHCIKH